MSDFPTLKTEAVMQYPAQKSINFSTAVVRFVDGSEQRFRQYQTALHRWVVKLDLLDETELQRLRAFFRTQSGASGSFAFTDPWDGTRYPHCSFEGDLMKDTLLDEAHGATSLSIREDRS
jgi:phage-related protein